nr:MAG TPA: hypothetical protein [Caudoviricetes sp.]
MSLWLSFRKLPIFYGSFLTSAFRSFVLFVL